MNNKNTPPQDCRSFEDLISQWVFENDVDEKILAPVKGHIKTCDSCRLLKTEYQEIHKSLGQDEIGDCPEEVKIQVMAQIQGVTARRKAPVLRYVATAASIAVIAVLCAQQFSQPPAGENLSVQKVKATVETRDREEEAAASRQRKAVPDQIAKLEKKVENLKKTSTARRAVAATPAKKPAKPQAKPEPVAPAVMEEASKIASNLKQASGVKIVRVKASELKNFKEMCALLELEAKNLQGFNKKQVAMSVDYKDLMPKNRAKPADEAKGNEADSADDATEGKSKVESKKKMLKDKKNDVKKLAEDKAAKKEEVKREEPEKEEAKLAYKAEVWLYFTVEPSQSDTSKTKPK